MEEKNRKCLTSLQELFHWGGWHCVTHLLQTTRIPPSEKSTLLPQGLRITPSDAGWAFMKHSRQQCRGPPSLSLWENRTVPSPQHHLGTVEGALTLLCMARQMAAIVALQELPHCFMVLSSLWLCSHEAEACCGGCRDRGWHMAPSLKRSRDHRTADPHTKTTVPFVQHWSVPSEGHQGKREQRTFWRSLLPPPLLPGLQGKMVSTKSTFQNRLSLVYFCFSPIKGKGARVDVEQDVLSQCSGVRVGKPGIVRC